MRKLWKSKLCRTHIQLRPDGMVLCRAPESNKVKKNIVCKVTAAVASKRSELSPYTLVSLMRKEVNAGNVCIILYLILPQMEIKCLPPLQTSLEETSRIFFHNILEVKNILLSFLFVVDVRLVGFIHANGQVFSPNSSKSLKYHV